jgi:hypothetical protein
MAAFINIVLLVVAASPWSALGEDVACKIPPGKTDNYFLGSNIWEPLSG